MPKAAATRPGPGRQASVGHGGAARRAHRGACRDARARRARAARIASTPSSGSTARTSSAAGPARGLGHDVEAVVHPVDKVHVGDARRPGHDPVAVGRAEPRVRRAVVLADVRLDLDDPPDAAAARGSVAGPVGGSGVADEPRAESARAASSVGCSSAARGTRAIAGGRRGPGGGRGRPLRRSHAVELEDRPGRGSATGRRGRPGSRSRGGSPRSSDQSIASRSRAGSGSSSSSSLGRVVCRKYWSRMIVRNSRNSTPCTTPEDAAQDLVDDRVLREHLGLRVGALDDDGERDRRRRRRSRGTRSSPSTRRGTASSSGSGSRPARRR